MVSDIEIESQRVLQVIKDLGGRNITISTLIRGYMMQHTPNLCQYTYNKVFMLDTTISYKICESIHFLCAQELLSVYIDLNVPGFIYSDVGFDGRRFRFNTGDAVTLRTLKDIWGTFVLYHRDKLIIINKPPT